MTDPIVHTAIVLQGGGALGAHEYGVLQALDFSKVPEWLALLGGLGREVWAWFVQGWSMSVGPLLAAAPEWVIGLVVLVVVVVVLRAAGVLR